jgi:hypothetical protein
MILAARATSPGLEPAMIRIAVLTILVSSGDRDWPLVSSEADTGLRLFASPLNSLDKASVLIDFIKLLHFKPLFDRSSRQRLSILTENLVCDFSGRKNALARSIV